MPQQAAIRGERSHAPYGPIGANAVRSGCPHFVCLAKRRVVWRPPPRWSGHALSRGNRAARRCRPARRPTSAPIRVTVVAAEPVAPFCVCLARASVRSRSALHGGVRCSEVVQANCACVMQAPTQGSKRTDLPYVLGRAAATPGLALLGTHDRWAAKLEFRFIHPHAMHDDRQFASNGNACFLRADLLGELYAPHAKCRPFFGNAQM